MHYQIFYILHSGYITVCTPCTDLQFWVLLPNENADWWCVQRAIRHVVSTTKDTGSSPVSSIACFVVFAASPTIDVIIDVIPVDHTNYETLCHIVIAKLKKVWDILGPITRKSPVDAWVTRDSVAIQRTGNSAIRSADPENTSLEPNM